MRGGAKRGGGFRINEEIRIQQVRLVDAEGQMQGVVPAEVALQQAQEAGLDLVEVSPNADPPVCKILDYGKFKYEQQKRDHEARRRHKGGELKEVRFRPKTDTHDREIKLNRARAFLQSGHRVQLTMLFRGREMQHRDLGGNMLREIAKDFEQVAKVEQGLRSEGRRMHLTLIPKPGATWKEQAQQKGRKQGKGAEASGTAEVAKDAKDAEDTGNGEQAEGPETPSGS